MGKHQGGYQEARDRARGVIRPCLFGGFHGKVKAGQGKEFSTGWLGYRGKL